MKYSIVWRVLGGFVVAFIVAYIVGLVLLDTSSVLVTSFGAGVGVAIVTFLHQAKLSRSSK